MSRAPPRESDVFPQPVSPESALPSHARTRPAKRRIEHALIHTFASQHDDGSVMSRTTPRSSISRSALRFRTSMCRVLERTQDTAKRILIGYATDLIGPLIAEVPAGRRQAHSYSHHFTQQIMNRIASGIQARLRLRGKKYGLARLFANPHFLAAVRLRNG